MSTGLGPSIPTIFPCSWEIISWEVVSRAKLSQHGPGHSTDYPTSNHITGKSALVKPRSRLRSVRAVLVDGLLHGPAMVSPNTLTSLLAGSSYQVNPILLPQMPTGASAIAILRLLFVHDRGGCSGVRRDASAGMAAPAPLHLFVAPVSIRFEAGRAGFLKTPSLLVLLLSPPTCVNVPPLNQRSCSASRFLFNSACTFGSTNSSP